MEKPIIEIEAKDTVVETRRSTAVHDLIADTASVIVLLCAIVWYGVQLVIIIGMSASPPLGMGPPFPGVLMVVVLVTAIPAMIAALTAVALVGWRRSRLAWGSLIAYLAGSVLVPLACILWNWVGSQVSF